MAFPCTDFNGRAFARLLIIGLIGEPCSPATPDTTLCRRLSRCQPTDSTVMRYGHDNLSFSRALITQHAIQILIVGRMCRVSMRC